MEKKLASYETMYVVDGTLADDAIAAIVAKFTALVNDNATDVTVNEWGKRRLAYPINYKNEGYYVLLNYKSEPAFPHEIERVLGITDGIIRSMTTRFDGTVVTAATAEVAPAEKATAQVEATAVSETAEEKAE
jgi:small subunit ribosomal protein S6